MTGPVAEKHDHCAMSHSSTYPLSSGAEETQDSLVYASNDGPNESKVQKKSPEQPKQSQQPADPFQDAVNNFEGALGNALQGKNQPGDRFGELASKVAGELNQVGNSLLSNLDRTAQNSKSPESAGKTASGQKNNDVKSVDGTNDDEPANIAPSNSPEAGTTMSGILSAVKGAFGDGDAKDGSAVTRAVESGREISDQVGETATNMLKGAESEGGGSGKNEHQ